MDRTLPAEGRAFLGDAHANRRDRTDDNRCLTAPAYARGKGNRQASGQQTEEQKEKAAEAEKAYKDALGKIPDQKPADPWGGMR
jgi:hypothetical protein